MGGSSSVPDHYASGTRWTGIVGALDRAGLTGERLDWESLAPLDQFHNRGLIASRELAAKVSFAPGDRVLDVGSGIGGSARFLAATYDVHITGIDLTPEYVQVASALSARTGLDERTTFLQADALKLPFDDASFDVVWSQHVAMNIRDRDTLYAEMHRVVKPGGRFAIHDVIEGNGDPLAFPVPWASTPEMNHLVKAEALRSLLTQSGFVIDTWDDVTESTLMWLEAQQQASASDAPGIGLHVLFGSGFREMVRGMWDNMSSGRLRVVQTTGHRPAD